MKKFNLKFDPNNESFKKFSELINRKIETDKLIPVLLFIAIAFLLILTVFIYRVGETLTILRNDIVMIPAKQMEFMNDWKEEVTTNIKVIKENLKLVKENITAANLSEFQATIIPKIEDISKAASSIQNVADRDSLNNLKNKVDGINENCRTQTEQINEKLKQMKFEDYRTSMNTKLDEIAKNMQTSLGKLNKAVDRYNIDTVQQELARKIDNTMSYLTSEMKKLGDKVGGKASKPASSAASSKKKDKKSTSVEKDLEE